MTAVYIRHEDDDEPSYLGDVPMLELDKVIPLLDGKSLYHRGQGRIHMQEENFSVQFVIDNKRGAYFEIAVTGELF